MCIISTNRNKHIHMSHNPPVTHESPSLPAGHSCRRVRRAVAASLSSSPVGGRAVCSGPGVLAAGAVLAPGASSAVCSET